MSKLSTDVDGLLLVKIPLYIYILGHIIVCCSDPKGLDKEAQEWPEYDMETQQTIVIYGNHTTIGSYPFASTADFWTNIIPAAINTSRKADVLGPVDFTSGSCSADTDSTRIGLILFVPYLIWESLA